MLAGIVGEAAARFGDRPALVPDGGVPLTYAELHEASDAVAAALAADGLGDGLGGRRSTTRRTPTGSWPTSPCPSSARSHRASTPAWRRPSATRCWTGSPPDRVLADGDVAALGSRVARRTSSCDVPDRDPERPCVVVFTSGTTGEPKGAEFRERHLDAIAAIDLGDRAGEWGGGGPMLASTQFAHIGFSHEAAVVPADRFDRSTCSPGGGRPTRCG